jgi:hypothetical protein
MYTPTPPLGLPCRLLGGAGAALDGSGRPLQSPSLSGNGSFLHGPTTDVQMGAPR